MTRPLPAWRSLLFVPVLSERFLAKAHTRGADALILDLEDSIIPANKEAARQALAAAVPRVAQSGADVVVLIEGPAALPHLYAIAAEPRMAGMSVGGEDMATELGAIPSADSMNVFAMQGLAAARAAGILPMGSMGQLANIDDLDSYRAGLRRGKALGFTTAACIHPAHVPIINEEYGASAAELDRARRLIAAFGAAAADGAGAVAFEGSMIDLPVVIRARRLLERAASWAR